MDCGASTAVCQAKPRSATVGLQPTFCLLVMFHCVYPFRGVFLGCLIKYQIMPSSPRIRIYYHYVHLIIRQTNHSLAFLWPGHSNAIIIAHPNRCTNKPKWINRRNGMLCVYSIYITHHKMWKSCKFHPNYDYYHNSGRKMWCQRSCNENCEIIILLAVKLLPR